MSRRYHWIGQLQTTIKFCIVRRPPDSLEHQPTEGSNVVTASPERIPCPFTYANGKRCSGHIVRIAAFKADVEWSQKPDGQWEISVGDPRSHYHLYCSEKNSHAGAGRDDALKYYLSQLPEALRKVV
jgi:hypothetical protein